MERGIAEMNWWLIGWLVFGTWACGGIAYPAFHAYFREEEMTYSDREFFPVRCLGWPVSIWVDLAVLLQRVAGEAGERRREAKKEAARQKAAEEKRVAEIVAEMEREEARERRASN